ncbi:MAG: protein phosphatase 2C domain-containing protein [Bacteroidales bacterium]|nr:protein phosphatase 2C domain-containing protein [Bacteroidales bacterium]
MFIKAEAISDKGLRRSNNEDHILLDDELFTDNYLQKQFDSGTLHAVFAVADGIGGHRAGEIASKEVLKDLFRFTEQLPSGLTVEEIRSEFINWIRSIHENLKKMSVENPAYEGMGTTLTGAYFYYGNIYVFHAGDSRLYLFRNNTLKQLTTDHTLAWLTNDTTIPSNYIANSVGGGKTPFIDFHDITPVLNAGDKLMICSDGLTDMLKDKDLEQMLAHNDIKNILKEVYEKGARDNTSILLLSIIES